MSCIWHTGAEGLDMISCLHLSGIAADLNRTIELRTTMLMDVGVWGHPRSDLGSHAEGGGRRWGSVGRDGGDVSRDLAHEYVLYGTQSTL